MTSDDSLEPVHDDSWPLPAEISAQQARESLEQSLAGLTEAQRAAVEHAGGPLLVIAGPGSGKTRVMTHRIARLIDRGVPAYQIVALTFTNKAALELKERIAKIAPGADVWAGTFHRFCSRLLRRYAPLVGLAENFTIYDRDDQRRAMKEALAESDVELFHYTLDQVANEIGRAKNRWLDPLAALEAKGDPISSIAVRIYPHYRRRLLESNAVDFDDLLLHTANLLNENLELRAALDHRFRHLLVDEYQDTNAIQYAIVRALSIDHPNLVVTGDPDQSIYGWRGADLNNILDFERDYPQTVVVRLERNYRSTQRILRVADRLISNNHRRRHKELFTENEEGDPVRLIHYPDHRDEAEQIADSIAERVASGDRRPSDFAIFYRINALSRSFEMALRKRGIPYQVVQGFEFYQRKEVKDVLSYLTLLSNPKDDLAFERVVNAPIRGIGRTTVEKLKRYSRSQGLSLLDGARNAQRINELSARPAKQLQAFASMIDQLALLSIGSVEEILGRVLSDSGYRESLEKLDSIEGQERLANIDELVNAAREYDASSVRSGNDQEGVGLDGFLEQAALVADTDAFEGSTDKVTLMTLHAAKGLEFPCVFLVALEHNLLPHSRAKDDPEQLEEERRLLFVGITRAKEELQLSLAHYRAQRGSVMPTSPSCFLMELPRDEMECRDPGVEAIFRLQRKSSWGDRQAEFRGDDPFSFDTNALDALDAFDGVDVVDADEAHEAHEAGEAADTAALRNDGENDIEESDEFRPRVIPRPTPKIPTRPAPAPVSRTIAFESESDEEASLRPPVTKNKSLDKSILGKIMTGAQFAGEAEPGGKVDPDRFREGQLVSHPEYGTGTIMNLSGSGIKRTGTVKFMGLEIKSFRLAMSKLVPIETPRQR